MTTPTHAADMDDALRLVEEQYAASAAIFASETAADALQAIYDFAGVAFASAQLAIVHDEATLADVRVVARRHADYTFVVDEPAILGDYPAVETLVALQPVVIADLSAAGAMLRPEERASLDARGTRALVMLPLAVGPRLTGFLAFEHHQPVTLPPPRLRALRHLADQMAVVFENRRLLEQTQAQVLRELKATRAMNALMSATDVRSVLDLAAVLFQDAMGAISTRVSLERASTDRDGDTGRLSR